MSYKVQNGKMVKKTKPTFTANTPFGRPEVDISEFRPDAGLAIPADADSHLWFQVAEFVRSIMSGAGAFRGYDEGGVPHIELTFMVDIMDDSGTTKLVASEDGHCATVAFTADDLREMAGQIRKGAMSVRITGRRLFESTTLQGERFATIRYRSSWSAGNNAGHMSYFVMVNGQMRGSSSDAVARFLEAVADGVADRSMVV